MHQELELTPADDEHRPGPKYKLADPEKRKLIYEVLRAGGSRALAAAKAKVTLDTIVNEARRDRQFSEGLIEAEADGELALVVKVQQASKGQCLGDWKAAAWMLERKHWQNWAKRQPDSMTPQQVSAALLQIVTLLLATLPAEYHARVKEAVDQFLACLKPSKA
jgi:hypothetical protein